MNRKTIIIIAIAALLLFVISIYYKDAINEPLEYVPATEEDIANIDYAGHSLKLIWGSSIDPPSHAFGFSFTVPDDYNKHGIKRITLKVGFV